MEVEEEVLNRGDILQKRAVHVEVRRRQRGSPTVNTESATEMISSLNAENTPRISVCSPYCSFSLLNPNLTSAAE